MSLSVTVFRLDDRPFLDAPPADVGSTRFDEWCVEAERRCLFEAPIAANGVLHRWWCTPSLALGGHLIPAIYDAGLTCQGDDLSLLGGELTALERHWVEAVGDDERMGCSIDGRRFEVPLLVHLTERASHLRSAIRIATTVPGELRIS